MGLRKLELENFKSYRGTHVVGPFDRFTCIVGPNGSGKSNIVDAITFCFGMNSAHLRSTSVRGLVHRGCGHARVSAFVVHEEREVVLGRHVSAGGRSTYSMDGEVVGYEEFRRQLQRMNILVDVKNFLVQQDDVGAMASMGPMELTRLFECVSRSGDLRDEYDRRLEAQTRALNECALKFEERKEMARVMREAKEAEEQEAMFKELVDRKDEIQKNIVLCKLREGSGRLARVRREIEELECEERKVGLELESKEREVDVCRSTAERAQMEYFLAENRECKERVRVRKTMERMYEASGAVSRREERRMELELELRSVLGDKEDLERGYRKRMRELEGVEEGYRIVCSSEEERKRRLSLSNENIGMISEKEKEFVRMTGECQEVLNALEVEMFPNRSLREHHEKKLCLLREKESELRGEMESKKVERKKTELKICALERSEREMEERIGESSKRYEEIVLVEREKRERLLYLSHEMMRKRGQRRMEQRRCAVECGVESLKTMFPGVYGRVVELVRPTQKKYEVALSVLVGSHDQSVVVDTEATAMSCINFMKEKKMCRMTFLPLQRMKELGLGDEVLRSGVWEESRGLEGVTRPAMDTVTYDARYKRVVWYLLGKSVIADTVEIAREVCYGRGARVSVCTLDGVYFHGDGNLITGGSRGNRFSESEVEGVMGERARVMSSLREIEEEKNRLSHVEIARERMEIWRESRIREAGRLSEIERSISEMEGRLESNARQQLDTEEELRRVSEEIELCSSRMKELQEKISRMECEVFLGVFPNEEFCSYREYKECRDSSEFVQRSMEYEDIRHRLGLRTRHLLQEIRRMEEDVERVKGEMSEMETSVEVEDVDVDGLERELEVLLEEKKGRLRMFEDAKASLRRSNDELGRLVSRKNELDRNILCSVSMRERLEEEVRECLNFATIEEIEVPYVAGGVGIVDGVEEIDFSGLSGTQEELSAELERINQRIGEQAPCGKVGQGEEDRSRYMAICGEYERLKEAAVEARRMFNEVRKRRTHVFMECFERVNREVSRIYRSLTATEASSGNAYLAVENTAEPFKEGVRFHLMPPSKRLREVRFLSGGEKTMAVLSLLFSFHSYRPVPFYVFDEVDSALDKKNVSRAVSFMVSCGVQFVVVTLKPALFQHGDALVGVYKDPHGGVSRMLTYRLSE